MAPKTVAILVANPALSSILGMVLAAVPTLRVRSFESLVALTTYMRLAPVALIVADLDSDIAPADLVAQTLRRERGLENPDFELIALTGGIGRSRPGTGIDEVMVKPMSPKYLLERVLARLHGIPPRPAPGRRRPQPPLPGNVVPLFGRRPETLH